MGSGTVGIALLGAGTVGTAVANLLQRRASAFQERFGVGVRLVGIAVRDPARERPGLALGDVPLVTDVDRLVADPEVTIVVEATGNVEDAARWLGAAMASGKHVVTANKELLARRGVELLAAARKAGVPIHFEGAVAGGIPVIAAIRRSLAANELQAVYGIVNGTTNYMLTRMAEEGLPYVEALREAQALGYAEPDPTADVEGFDATYKIAILAALLGGGLVAPEAIGRTGISAIAPVDLLHARDMGYTVKLLALARRVGEGLAIGVHPTMIPAAHPLASIRLVSNAVAVRGDAVGEVVMAGPGAGGEATASAVVGDVLACLEGLGRPTASPDAPLWHPGRCLGPDDMQAAHYIRLLADDRPGVLGALGTAFGQEGISIRRFHQQPAAQGQAEMVFVTHAAPEGAFERAVRAISLHPAIRGIACRLRVEDQLGR